MASNLRPRVSKKQGKLHTRPVYYALPHRLNCAKVYPVSAPNGSQIIIYGHETGLNILWRGGRSLKKSSNTNTQHKAAPPPQVNGAPQDVIVIDSDDEEPQQAPKKSKPQVQPAEFEQEDEEHDPLNPSPPIVQSFNIRLGVEVLTIALPPVPPSLPLQLPEHFPDFFSKKLLVAVTCADRSVKLVAIPLAPPSHTAKAQQHIGEQILSIGGPLHHQEHINCISLTWALNEVENDEDEDDMEVEPNTGRSKAAHPNPQGGQTGAQHPGWRFLVASHSAQYFGSLLIYSIPLMSDKDGGNLADGAIYPLRNQYLKCPLSSLTFSTSHIHLETPVQLLMLDQKSSVKIYEPFTSPAEVIQSRSRRRGGQRSTGAWLTSFTPGFDTTGSLNSATVHRKRILDAQWLLNPRAIIVLFSDGEWGMWCLDKAPSGSGPSITGGAITQFTMHGYLVSPDDSNSRSNNKARGLTPATPNTRKTRTADFLSGSSAKSHVIRGGIRVTSTDTLGNGSDERVLMWYDNQVFAVPGFRTYWQRNVANQGNATTSYGSSFPKVEDLELQGERCNDVEQLPGPGIPPTGLPELLVAGEHRLTCITKAPGVSQPTASLALAPTTREVAMDDADQTLLGREELDLGGVNRLLDGMEGSSKEQRHPRRVGFAY